jgi:hypothetical protein
VVPFRHVGADTRVLAALAADFRRMRDAGCEVIVVDGSPLPDYARHADAWRALCRHVPVDPRWRFLNGKVNGVLTGVEHTRTECLILADDDVVYTAADVDRMCAMLAHHDLVVPQNYFRPLPWWARVETGRILLNRACRAAGDYPGTFGVRRSTFLRLGPYDGDVLFENEEMRRHFLSHGARVRHARDFFIARRPPPFAKWREQRVRQAYEDLGFRAKTALFVALVPLAAATWVLAGAGGMAAYAALVAVASVLLAAVGRGDGAARVVPPAVCLWAPLWVVERAVSVHRAVWARLIRGGCAYGGNIIARGLRERAAA